MCSVRTLHTVGFQIDLLVAHYVVKLGEILWHQITVLHVQILFLLVLGQKICAHGPAQLRGVLEVILHQAQRNASAPTPLRKNVYVSGLHHVNSLFSECDLFPHMLEQVGIGDEAKFLPVVQKDAMSKHRTPV